MDWSTNHFSNTPHATSPSALVSNKVLRVYVPTFERKQYDKENAFIYVLYDI